MPAPTAQTLQPPPPPVALPSMTDGYAPYVLIALAGVLLWKLLPDILKGLWSKAMAADAKQLDEAKVRGDGQEQRLRQLEVAIPELRGEVRQTHADVQSVRGSLAELRSNLDQRFEKQAEFYRSENREQTEALLEKLDSVERQLRGDMQRGLADVMHEATRDKKRRS